MGGDYVKECTRHSEMEMLLGPLPDEGRYCHLMMIKFNICVN